jgi:predicted nucleic acid-binding protein
VADVASLVESSLWIDFTRPRTKPELREFIRAQLREPNVCVAEPIIFEVLRLASEAEATFIQEQFAAVPVLETPRDLWTKAHELGRVCRRNAVIAGALDLLIATIAIHHNVEVITFDRGFAHITAVSRLRARVLQRPQA